ncbi:hypothetical protein thalar_00674 [Litoreibacter arenae DSM 19593]|uniref:Uncharacterized protein n=1 Tax=Litoreibacter arenae DSM 19593 TaxID=1123360 RepID=S9S4X8_9RHOB|nr:hypothetical protein thalar_00674 [Litoreibacter arenae DSM 19593]
MGLPVFGHLRPCLSERPRRQGQPHKAIGRICFAVASRAAH